MIGRVDLTAPEGERQGTRRDWLAHGDHAGEVVYLRLHLVVDPWRLVPLPRPVLGLCLSLDFDLSCPWTPFCEK